MEETERFRNALVVKVRHELNMRHAYCQGSFVGVLMMLYHATRYTVSADVGLAVEDYLTCVAATRNGELK